MKGNFYIKGYNNAVLIYLSSSALPKISVNDFTCWLGSVAGVGVGKGFNPLKVGVLVFRMTRMQTVLSEAIFGQLQFDSYSKIGGGRFSRLYLFFTSYKDWWALFLFVEAGSGGSLSE